MSQVNFDAMSDAELKRYFLENRARSSCLSGIFRQVQSASEINHCQPERSRF